MLNLPNLLKEINKLHPDDEKRYGLILDALAVAHHHGIKTNLQIICEKTYMFFALPTGQISFRIDSQRTLQLYEHSIDRKKRIDDFCEQWPKINNEGEEEWFVGKIKYIKRPDFHIDLEYYIDEDCDRQMESQSDLED